MNYKNSYLLCHQCCIENTCVVSTDHKLTEIKAVDNFVCLGVLNRGVANMTLCMRNIEF